MYHFSEGTGPGVAIANFNVIIGVEMCGRRFVGFNEKHNVIYFPKYTSGATVVISLARSNTKNYFISFIL